MSKDQLSRKMNLREQIFYILMVVAGIVMILASNVIGVRVLGLIVYAWSMVTILYKVGQHYGER